MPRSSAYTELLVESFRPASRSGHRGSIEIRPLPGQHYPPSMLLECSRRMVDTSVYPLGTTFKVWVRFKQKLDGRPHLYSYHGDPIEVIGHQTITTAKSRSRSNASTKKAGVEATDASARKNIDPIVSEDDESAFPEGAELFRRHRHLERDGSMPRRAKAKRLAETGKLECEVCSVDFQNVYGDLGSGFIEAHHRVPVHQLDGRARTKVKELALVCSNCHRMLHRARPPLTVEELRDHVRGNATSG